MIRTCCAFSVLLFGLGGCALYERSPSSHATQPVRHAPARCKGGPTVRMHARPLSPYVYQEGDGYAYFDVWLEACQPPGRSVRQPLDIALVVDTSGSMSGAKIVNARAAALYLLSVLGPADRLALITYDSRVYAHFPLTPVTAANRRSMAARISSIYPRGMTNLGGGLQVGAAQLSRATERNAVSRVILISDGMTNVGVVDRGTLNAMAAAARRRRVGVTTMGVGLRFYELLLQSLAEYGGGRYHYISKPRDLVAIFRREVLSAQQTVATAVNIRLDACPGCRVEAVPGYALRRAGRSATFTVSDLAGGEVTKALVKVKLPVGAVAGDRRIALRLSYATPSQRRKMRQVSSQVAFKLTRDRAKVRQTTDVVVAGRLARVQANQLAHQAMTAYQSGNAGTARKLLRRAAGRLRGYARRYRVKKKTYMLEASSLSAAAERVSRPSAQPSHRLHLIKSMRSKASAAYRK